VTYHIQASSNLGAWSDIATYAGSSIVLTAQAMEISRIGAPNETVTIRELTASPAPLPLSQSQGDRP